MSDTLNTLFSNPSTPVLTLAEGGIATITLNRPAHRNRLENADLKALLHLFAQLDADPSIRVVVLTANTTGQPKPVFCAGYHIGGFGTEDESGSALFERVADALAVLHPVTICALNGSVYGGATDLVLACDLRVALDGIEFRMPATALGLHYYPSGLQRYVARLGVSAAKRAFLTARPFTAQMLWNTGCLEAVVPDSAGMQTTVAALVQEVSALAPLAVRATKQSINEIATGQPNWPAMREREALTSESEDFAEGRRAFAERRKPVFVGH